MKRVLTFNLIVLLPVLWAGGGEASSLLSSPGSPADISLFRGLAGAAGSIEIYDEAGVIAVQRPPLLQGIVLLDVDFVGRTPVGELDPSKPRYRSDVASAARVELPGGMGSVYHYRRDGQAGAASAFGYFLIDANGTAGVFLERDGTGVAGTVDPFQPKLGVDVSGASLLLATTFAAGGDLLSIDLANGLVTDHTTSLGAQDFTGNGLALGIAFGIGVTTTGVLRFDTTVQGQATPVTFPSGAPGFFQGDVTLSNDGNSSALIAGTSALSAHVYCITASGAASQVSQTARAMTGGGFLPEVFDGPHLALSTDGSTCIWSSEELLARETWASSVTHALQIEEQITGDSRFVDTLDTSGGILPYQANSFLLVVGEQDVAVGGIENADVYSVVVDNVTGLTTVTNISLTSGDTTTPFESGGTISDGEGIWWIPNSSMLLVLADENLSGGTNSLMGIDALNGTTQTLIPNVRHLSLIEVVSSQLVLGMTRRIASVDSTEVFSLPQDLSTPPNLLGFADTELVLDRTVARASGLVTFVASLFPVEYLVRLDVNTGSLETLTAFPLLFGTGLDITPSGAVALSIGIPDIVMGYGTWPVIGAPTILPAGLLPGQVLPH